MDIKQYFNLLQIRLRYKIAEIRVRSMKVYANWKQKGRERLTIMIIPHNEKRTVNFEISYKSISIFIGMVVFLMILSAINVLSHSGSVHELTELNLSNQDFIAQSKKMKGEVRNLGKSVDYYYDKISDLYIKLGGNPAKLSRGQGGYAGSIAESAKQEFNPTLEEATDIPEETFQLKEEVHKLKLTTELTAEIITMLKKRKNVIKHTPSIWPSNGYILNPFGKYVSSISGKSETSKGVDIAAFPGSEIKVTAPGEVYETGYSEQAGYYVKVAHKYTWKTIYANLEKINVQKNQKISRGEVIGYLGRVQGNSTSYLHYEIHVGTQAINPVPFLNKIQ